MSLDYGILKYKPDIVRVDERGAEDYMKDLLARTWKNDEEMQFMEPVIVSKEYIARPDLISLAVYGTDEYADLICKYNGISNPFELNEGMLLSIPSTDWMDESIRYRETQSCDLIDDSSSTIRKPHEQKIKERDDARTSSDRTVGDPPPYFIDKRVGLVFY